MNEYPVFYLDPLNESEYQTKVYARQRQQSHATEFNPKEEVKLDGDQNALLSEAVFNRTSHRPEPPQRQMQSKQGWNPNFSIIRVPDSVWNAWYPQYHISPYDSTQPSKIIRSPTGHTAYTKADILSDTQYCNQIIFKIDNVDEWKQKRQSRSISFILKGNTFIIWLYHDQDPECDSVHYILEWRRSPSRTLSIALLVKMWCKETRTRMNESALFKSTDASRRITIPQGLCELMGKKDGLRFGAEITILKTQMIGSDDRIHVDSFVSVPGYLNKLHTRQSSIEQFSKILQHMRMLTYLQQFMTYNTDSNMFCFNIQSWHTKRRDHHIVFSCHLLRLPSNAQAVRIAFGCAIGHKTYIENIFRAKDAWLDYDKSKCTMELERGEIAWIYRHKDMGKPLMLTLHAHTVEYLWIDKALGSGVCHTGGSNEEKHDPQCETMKQTVGNVKQTSIGSTTQSQAPLSANTEDCNPTKAVRNTDPTKAVHQEYAHPSQRRLLKHLSRRKLQLDELLTNCKVQQLTLQVQIQIFENTLNLEKHQALERFESIEAAFQCEVERKVADLKGVNEYCKETWDAFCILEEEIKKGNGEEIETIFHDHLSSCDKELPVIKDDLSSLDMTLPGYDAMEKANAEKENNTLQAGKHVVTQLSKSKSI
eukprot:471680_1